MSEDIFRNRISPGHLPPNHQSVPNAIQIDLRIVVGNIPDWHIGIQKLKRLPLPFSPAFIEYFKERIVFY